MTGKARYDRIGATYSSTRRPDARIEAQIVAALGDARSVVNVGAGTGSYEPRDREVIAIEPSAVMRAQRPRDLVQAIDASAERLPLADDSVDAALACLTIHHWSDPAGGCAEMLRVARDRVIFFGADVERTTDFWLADYFEEVLAAEAADIPPFDISLEWLGSDARIEPVPIPHDCTDGFLGAFWRRPHAYLDPEVRAGISTFARRPDHDLGPGLTRLARDIESGAWNERYAHLLSLDELDMGYQLIIKELG